MAGDGGFMPSLVVVLMMGLEMVHHGQQYETPVKALLQMLLFLL
jgi:hypothetical protein